MVTKCMVAVSDVARAVKTAWDIREMSFDQTKVSYSLTLEAACEKSCAFHKIDPEFAKLIFLALHGWSNDTIAWADRNT